MKVVLLACFVFLVQILQINSSYPCELMKTCKQCIRNVNMCSWCSMDNFDGPRCQPSDAINKTGCINNQIENPSKSILEVSNPKVTQIRPKQYNIKMRPGEQIEFDIFYNETKDYPVDLYFLIDASKSISSIRNAIAEASKKIYDSMTNLTKNVHLGMGSFSDKNTAPYIMRQGVNDNTYSFRHHVNMTKDYNTFSSIVKGIPIQQNYDKPESGLDGLGQVMACGKDVIGWREASRKIIIYVSNDRFHGVGDGKHAGIVQPFDGKCYTVNGYYTKELEMDYPSLSILNKLATDKGFNIIFAVDEKMKGIYDNLASNIRGTKVVSFEGINVTFNKHELDVELTNIYREISKNIKLKTNEARKPIKLSFNPDCTDKGNKNSNCTITRGEIKHIKGYVTLEGAYEINSISIEIGIEGVEEEKMKLEITVANCDCETNTSVIHENSEDCTGAGSMKCGICECNPGRNGEKCECPAGGSTNATSDGQAGCRPPQSSIDTALCSGFGTCNCGACLCRPGYTGKYCDCNINRCPNKCSGNGDCQCNGSCYCHKGWDGDSCDCSTKQCSIANGKICNGRGNCHCARCVCEHLPSSWDARLEQDDTCVPTPCSKCHDKQCAALASCAICHMNRETSYDCLATCDYHVQVEVTKDITNSTKDKAIVCENMLTDIAGCYTRFQYEYDDANYMIKLLVQSDRNCNESYYLYGGTALAVLIIVGILTLIAWKVITDMRDRHEYTQFMKAHGGDVTGPVDNPIFEPATTTFSNPAFNNGHALEQTPLERMSIIN